MTLAARALSLGTALLLLASGCHVPGVVLSLDADPTVKSEIDSYCVSLTASGRRSFGQRYTTSSKPLEETVGIKYDGQRSMVARLDGYAGGLRVASDAQTFELPTQAPSLTLAACAPKGQAVSASAFHARDGLMLIADRLAFVHTGVETPGASSFAAAGARVGFVASYTNGMLNSVSTPSTPVAVESLVAIDYDADCADDLVLSTSGTTETAWHDGVDGTFGTDGSPFPSGLGAASAIASADVNGDGIPDLVGVGAASGASFVLLGNGAQAFTQSDGGFDTQPPPGSQAAVLGDVDGDHKLDLVVGFAQDVTRWWKGDGTGNFALAAQTIPAMSAVSIALADVDGDTHLDILAAVTDGEPGLRVLLGDGQGNFTDQTTTWVPNTLDASGLVVNVVDVDGDCVAEILFGGSTSAARLLGVSGGKLQDRGAIGSQPAHALGAADLDGDEYPEIVLLTFSDIEIFSSRSGS